MDNIKTTDVLLTMNNDTSPAHVAPAGDHNDVAGVKLNEVSDFILLDVKLDGVVDPDGGVRVADGSAVVGNDIWNALRAKGYFSNLKKLIAGFLRCNAVDGETTLDVVKKAEVFARLLDGDNIWGTENVIKFHWTRYSWRAIPMKPAG